MSHDRDGRAALPYLPGLDGLRGLAIAAILVYHLDRRWLPGGVISITVFFTLSGFLITSLLLNEVDRTGRVDLKAFWMRRARRLAPAAVFTVGLIALLTKVAGAAVDRTLIGDAVGALTWTANWRFITAGSSYAQVFEHPSPFQHFWTLAIEEQLYVVLPLVAFALLAGGRKRWRFAGVLVAGIAAATTAGVFLHGHGHEASRAYYGTDVRIAEPLVGALLAVVMMRSNGLRRFAQRGRVVLGVGGLVAFAFVGWMMWHVTISDDVLYHGGFLLAALATAVVIASATQDGPITRVLSAPPLVGLGKISYGVYLFHWPLFLFIADRLRDSSRPTVIATQLTATFALALLSNALLELPIRRRQRNVPAFAVGWANASIAVLAAVALTAIPASAATVTPLLGPSVDAAPPPPPTVAAAAAAPPVETARGVSPATTAPRATTKRGGTKAAPPPPVDVEQDPIVGGGNGGGSAPAPEPAPTPASDALRVVVIGDSLGWNLGNGLDDWAKDRDDVVVYNLAISGCPLSRGGERRFDDTETFQIDPKCGWWDDTYSERAQDLATFDPQVVVVADGLNELLDRKLPDWPDWRRPGEPQYHQWLLSEYGSMMNAITNLAPSKPSFFFLNAPCGDWQRLSNWRRVSGPDERVQALDQSVYPVIVNATQGDLFTEICPNGKYSDTLYGIDDARPDGVHLSTPAADELAKRWLGPKVFEVANARNQQQPIGIGNG